MSQPEPEHWRVLKEALCGGGATQWNNWVALWEHKNEEKQLNFSGISFGEIPILNFEGFKFPSVSFNGVTFPFSAYFSDAEFSAKIDFTGATFEKNLHIDAKFFRQVPRFHGATVNGEIIFPQNILGCFGDTQSSHATECYAFLKSYAEKQRNFRAEQAFYVLQMRAEAHQTKKAMM